MAALRAGLPVKNHTFSACDARARRSWRGYRGGLCHVSLPPNFSDPISSFAAIQRLLKICGKMPPLRENTNNFVIYPLKATKLKS